MGKLHNSTVFVCIALDLDKFLTIHFRYFVADRYGEESMQWWQSGANGAAHIDFTNREASEWFKNRVKRIHRLSGIDSFKFDAGESSWIPKVCRRTNFFFFLIDFQLSALFSCMKR